MRQHYLFKKKSPRLHQGEINSKPNSNILDRCNVFEHIFDIDRL
jgi:hypothetical protein